MESILNVDRLVFVLLVNYLRATRNILFKITRNTLTHPTLRWLSRQVSSTWRSWRLGDLATWRFNLDSGLRRNDTSPTLPPTKSPPPPDPDK